MTETTHSNELKEEYPKSHGLLTNFMKTANQLLEKGDTIDEGTDDFNIRDSKFEDTYTVGAWELFDDLFINCVAVIMLETVKGMTSRNVAESTTPLSRENL